MPTDIAIYIALVLYKVCVLAVGIALSYMGFRLFALDKTADAGSFEANLGAHKLTLTKAAPGVFFTLFGTIIICLSIFKGIEYTRAQEAPAKAVVQPPVLVIPETDPLAG